MGPAVINGALAGVVGAACMSPLRILARRSGLIEKTVPQVIEEALAGRLGVGRRAGAERHSAVDHLLHFTYGAVLGAAYRLAVREGQRRIVRRGVALGTGTWLLGAGVVVPLLGATRPPWRARLRENLVNVAAHLVFGLVTALLADDLARQRGHGPTSDLRRWFTRVG